MVFSFSTLYMAIIASNVLLILMTFCFRNKNLMLNAGYRILSLFLICTLIRFALPIELPFTRTIYWPEWLSGPIMWVRHPLFYIGQLEITLWTFLLCIWFIGIAIKLAKYIKTQLDSRYAILSHSRDATGKAPFATLLQRICTERKRKNVFCVFRVSGLDAPRLYGIFKPCILIPETLELSEQNWYYVLAHEAAHHFHRDLLIQLLIRLVDIIYWWNPFCRILVRQSDTILEMRIDDHITLSNRQFVDDYLRCLIQIKEHATELLELSTAVTVPFLSANEEDITRRFNMMVYSKKHKNHLLNFALLIIALSINILSYTFILEAYYTPKEVEETSMNVTEDAFYAISKEDGTYDIYYNGILIESTDSLEYHRGIQIYTEKEFNHEAH